MGKLISNNNFNKYSLMIFYGIIALFSLLRIYIGSNMQLWFVITANCDDLLLINYSNLLEHFAHWNIMSLTKNLSYSLFLSFVNFTGIPYSLWLSLLWIVGALFVAYGVYKYIFKNKILFLLGFIFVLFLPIGFDIATGMRIYRHAIMAPMAIISLSSLFIFLNDILKNSDRFYTVIWGLIAGFTFSFNYYIKEDGITFLPILLVSILFVLVFVLYSNYREFKKVNIADWIKIVIVCLVPVIVFAGTTVAYEQVNNHYFGIAEINTRTGGELGEFWHNLLKIDDENKTVVSWAPPSTLEKAWNASPTLKSHPDFLNAWKHSGWAGGDVYKYPLSGDIVAWSLRDAAHDVGLFYDEKSADDFFRQVNLELEEAFENGSLKKSDKIFITDSLNGKDMDEIAGIEEHFKAGLATNLFYEYISATQNPVDTEVDISSQTTRNEVTDHVETVLNEKIVTNAELSPAQKSAINLANLDIKFYQLISYVLVALSCLGFVLLVINRFRERFHNGSLNLLLGFEILLIGTFLVQIFAIAWFNVWIDKPPIERMEYYTAGCQGIFALFEVLTICGGIKLLDNWKKSKKT